MAIPDELTRDDRVQLVEAERDHLQGQLDAALLTISALKGDLTIIASELVREAAERGWCSDYRYFVENVNQKCSDAHLQPCRARWQLNYQVTVEVTSEDLDATEQQVYGELQLTELEAGELHNCHVSLTSRNRVEE